MAVLTRRTNTVTIGLACISSLAVILWSSLRPLLLSDSVGVSSIPAYAGVVFGMSLWRLLPYVICLLISSRTSRHGALFVSIAAIATTDLLFYWRALTATGNTEALGWAFLLLPLWHIAIYIAAWWALVLLVSGKQRAKR